MNVQFNRGEIELEDIRKVLPGFNGHMKRGDTWNFRQSVMKKLIYDNRYNMPKNNIESLSAQAKSLTTEVLRLYSKNDII